MILARSTAHAYRSDKHKRKINLQQYQKSVVTAQRIRGYGLGGQEQIGSAFYTPSHEKGTRSSFPG
jgi:hypothetical protein